MACGWFFKKIFLFICLSQLFIFSTGAETVPLDYLLPHHHPIKPILDYLFSSSRATLNLESLEEAGFIYSKPRKFTHLIIARHPLLPGYLFKLYLDAQRFHKEKPEHDFWMLRVQGARLVKQEIEAHNWQDLMKVPQKWIYRLPRKSAVTRGYMEKKYLLVEEDMSLFSEEENKKLWASSFVTLEHLIAVYHVLKNVGLSDCAKPDNMPFSMDGRIAFIDTQSHGRAVSYDHLSSFLSEENQLLWKHVVSAEKDP